MSDMSRLCLIFDLDDTLYPEHEFAYSGFRAVGRWAQDKWGIEGIADDMTVMLDSGMLGALFKESFQKHRPEHTEDEFQELRDIYRTHAPEIALFEDAQWAIDHFVGQVPLGVITDGTTEMQQAKVNALDISHQFDKIVFTHEGGGRDFHKPHPWSYEAIEAALGQPDARYVYVGDNAAKDFVTPNKRGWTSVQVKRSRTIHRQDVVADGGAPDHVISSLKDLPGILRG